MADEEHAAVMAPWDVFVTAVRDSLLEGWAARGQGRARLSAAVAHGLRFETWRSLARTEALADTETADLMVALARAAVSAARS